MTAVRILPGNEWKLDHQKCTEIFHHRDVIDRPVAIYSINGPSRQGKSLLLNLILHRLKKKGEWKKSQVENLFDWRGGTDTCTTGIFINHQPIFIEHFVHGKIAVFFMDSEGFYDMRRNKNDYNYKMFTLCSAISKFQMFNVFEQISDGNLDEIMTFKTMLEQADRNTNLVTHKAELLFLVRDFDDVDVGRGIEGGDQYLSRRMERYRHSSKTVWKDKPKCFLFSYPGGAIDDGVKCDVMRNADQQFLEEVENLVQFLFQQSFGPLMINEKPVLGKDMPELLFDLDKFLCKTEPNYVSGLQSMVRKEQEELVKECMEIYKTAMKTSCKEHDSQGAKEHESQGAKEHESQGTKTDTDSMLKNLPGYHKTAKKKALDYIAEKWPYQSSLEECNTALEPILKKCYQDEEDIIAAKFCEESIKEWKTTVKSIKFTCDDVRKLYGIYGGEFLLKLKGLVVNEEPRKRAVVQFKRQFKVACNEELDRLYDNKKNLKIAGSAVGGAAVLAPLIAIPPLLGIAIAATLPTGLIVAGGAAAFGSVGGGLSAAGTTFLTIKFGERIYVEELNG